MSSKFIIKGELRGMEVYLVTPEKDKCSFVMYAPLARRFNTLEIAKLFLSSLPLLPKYKLEIVEIKRD